MATSLSMALSVVSSQADDIASESVDTLSVVSLDYFESIMDQGILHEVAGGDDQLWGTGLFKGQSYLIAQFQYNFQPAVSVSALDAAEPMLAASGHQIAIL